MKTRKTTPPFSAERTIIYRYNERKFSNTIARLRTKKQLNAITIQVMAVDPSTGNCTNILESNLSGKEFDELAKRAEYTLYRGYPSDLRQIGVVA